MGGSPVSSLIVASPLPPFLADFAPIAALEDLAAFALGVGSGASGVGVGSFAVVLAVGAIVLGTIISAKVGAEEVSTAVIGLAVFIGATVGLIPVGLALGSLAGGSVNPGQNEFLGGVLPSKAFFYYMPVSCISC